MSLHLLSHREIWAVDFELSAPTGERPEPVCMVARELRTGRLVRAWRDDLRAMPVPPFPLDAGVLFISYYASAELGCFLTLGWPMPAHILDLCAEFKRATSGVTVPPAGVCSAQCCTMGWITSAPRRRSPCASSPCEEVYTRRMKWSIS